MTISSLIMIALLGGASSARNNHVLAIQRSKTEITDQIGVDNSRKLQHLPAKNVRRNTATWKPRVFVKLSCPFSMKLLIFLADAQLTHTVDIQLDTEENRAHIAEYMEPPHKKVGIPCAELTPGKITFETNDLIAHFAKVGNLEMNQPLPVFDFYSNGIFLVYNAFVDRLGGHAPGTEADEIMDAKRNGACCDKPEWVNETAKSLFADLNITGAPSETLNGRRLLKSEELGAACIHWNHSIHACGAGLVCQAAVGDDEWGRCVSRVSDNLLRGI
jgi:hypothetical protein